MVRRIDQARLGLIDGRFDDAQRINNDALQQAQDLGEPDGASWWGSVALALELLRGKTAAVVDAVGDLASQYPDFPAWWITHAVGLAAVGPASTSTTKQLAARARDRRGEAPAPARRPPAARQPTGHVRKAWRLPCSWPRRADRSVS